MLYIYIYIYIYINLPVNAIVRLSDHPILGVEVGNVLYIYIKY